MALKKIEYKFSKEEIQSLLDQFHDKLTENERECVIEIGIKKNKLSLVAKKMKLSKQGVAWLYQNAIKKLTK